MYVPDYPEFTIPQSQRLHRLHVNVDKGASLLPDYKHSDRYGRPTYPTSGLSRPGKTPPPFYLHQSPHYSHMKRNRGIHPCLFTQLTYPSFNNSSQPNSTLQSAISPCTTLLPPSLPTNPSPPPLHLQKRPHCNQQPTTRPAKGSRLLLRKTVTPTTLPITIFNSRHNQPLRPYPTPQPQILRPYPPKPWPLPQPPHLLKTKPWIQLLISPPRPSRFPSLKRQPN